MILTVIQDLTVHSRSYIFKFSIIILRDSKVMDFTSHINLTITFTGIQIK